MTVRVSISFVAPVVIPDRETVRCPASSAIVRLLRALSVGAWFTGVTVRMKVSVALLPLASVTRTVMTAEPKAVAVGVTVTVRFAPEPPNTMLLFGTRPVSEDVPIRVRLAAAVSWSAMVKAMAGVAALSAIVRSTMSERAGKSLTGPTTTLKVRATVLFCDCPSLTVTVIVAVPVELVAGRREREPVELGLE